MCNPESVDVTSDEITLREKLLKVFISWSGSPSKEVAELLSENLPSIINVIEPFMSQRDIGSGEQWSRRISAELDETSFGIFCLTRDNIDAPWLHFEAGAVSKLGGRVAGLLIGDLSPTDINNPLTQFQHRYFNERDFEKLILDINQTTDFKDEIIRKSLRAQWGEVEQQYKDILKTKYTNSPVKRRSVDDFMKEVLLRIRNVEKEVSSISKPVSKLASKPSNVHTRIKKSWFDSHPTFDPEKTTYGFTVYYSNLSSTDAEAFAKVATKTFRDMSVQIFAHSINHYQAGRSFHVTCQVDNGSGKSVASIEQLLRNALENAALQYFDESGYYVD